MFVNKCCLCGKVTFNLWGRVFTCPRCGNEFSTPTIGRSREPQGALRFPQRKSESFADLLKSQQQELYERGEVAEAAVYADVDDIFRERPFDIPFYTALNDRACILICFSRSFLSESVIQEVLNSGRPWVLYVRAFLDASYPLVRFNLVFPDNPANPLVLESPIDIKDGNFQDFCAAILTNEQIEIYLRHENGFAGCATFYAQGLSPIILKQVTLAVKALEPGATDADFDSSVTTMESVFPSPSAGLDAARFIWLAPCGAEHG